MKKQSTYTLLLSLITLVSLSACQLKDQPVMPLDFHAKVTERRLATEANEAIRSGKIEDAIVKFEKLYNSMSTRDTTVALNYAQLLRKKGFPEKSIKVLSPYVDTRRGKINSKAEPILINELAASVIETGDFNRAQNLLSEVFGNEEAKKFHADSHNLQGIILGAKKDYPLAEEHFRIALDGWTGDATSVKNNLAVCLASQAKFDEALMLLRQALIEAPEKVEIAKNIELISELRDAIIPMPNAHLIK